jgi:hypothetical protein
MQGPQQSLVELSQVPPKANSLKPGRSLCSVRWQSELGKGCIAAMCQFLQLYLPRGQQHEGFGRRHLREWV